MNWKKFLGDALYEKLLALCAGRNVTIASAVRTAIAEYVRKERK